MSSTVLYMSTSLDGFVTCPNETPEHGLGDGGQRLLRTRGVIDKVDLHLLPRPLGDGTRLYDVADGSMRKV